MPISCGRSAASPLKLTRLPEQAISSTPRVSRGPICSVYNPAPTHLSCQRHVRYASSSPSPEKSDPSTVRWKPRKKHSYLFYANVNPPLSTLPADLNLPPAPTSEEKQSNPVSISRYLKIGGAYLRFYKTGLVNAFSNYKDSLPIRRQLGLPSYIPSSPSFLPSSSRNNPSSSSGGATSLRTALQTLKINRADFQLVRRAAHDVRRLIPFGLIVIICGEFTPFVVAAVGDPVTPYTCRIPSQLAKTRAKRMELRRQAFAAVQGGLGSIKPMRDEDAMDWLATQFGSREFAATAPAEQVLRACAVFGLTNSLDRGTGWVSLIYRPRLRKWTEYLALDDELIVLGGGVDALSAREVRIALEERGGFVDAGEKSDAQVEQMESQWLKTWLEKRNFRQIEIE